MYVYMSKSNNNLNMIVVIVVALILFAVKYFLSDCRNIFGIPVSCRNAFCDCEKTCKNDSNEICKFNSWSKKEFNEQS